MGVLNYTEKNKYIFKICYKGVCLRDKLVLTLREHCVCVCVVYTALENDSGKNGKG